MDLLQHISSGQFLSGPETATIQLLGRVFSDELRHLKAASPTVESAGAASPTIPGDDQFSAPAASYLLYGAKYAEVDRTITSVLALKWILNADYETFTCAQKADVKLTVSSFVELNGLFVPWLGSAEDIYDLIVALLLSDVGKDSSLLQACKELDLSAQEHVNHDQAAFIAADHGHFAVLSTIPPARREDIKLGLEFAAHVNLPQLVQAEGVPGSLDSLEMMKNRPRAFAFKYMEVLLDVAGASAHIDPRGCVTMTQPVVGAYLVMYDALKQALDGQIDLRGCYDMVLDYRTTLLARNGFEIPSRAAAARHKREFTRLLSMGRVKDKATAELFLESFESLDTQTQTELANGLSVDGIDDGVAIIPYYMPGLMAVAQRQWENVPRASRSSIMSSLFRFLARVYDGTRPAPGNKSTTIETSVAFAGDIVASPQFRCDPTILDSVALQN